MKQYSYKIRLYPNNDQKEFLAKQFGCCRFVYNYMLDLKIKEYKAGNKLSKFDLMKKLTLLKKQGEYWLLSENQTICLETLDVKKMMHGSKLARSIASASWSMFVHVLKYKAEWLGKQVIQIPKYAVSTRKCCACGTYVDKIPLSVREWTCPHCGVHLDRDVNAARNILLQAVNLALGGDAQVHSWIDIADLHALGIQVDDTNMKREYRNNNVPSLVC